MGRTDIIYEIEGCSGKAKRNARDSHLRWFGSGWWFGLVCFLTLVSCPGDEARRYEDPQSISEHMSVVTTSLLPELS